MADQGLLLRIAVIEKNDRNQEVELVRKAMQFEPQTTVLDACAQIRSRLTEIRTLGNAKQYGLFLTDEDPKKGVWLEPTKTLEHYLLRNNYQLEYRKKVRLLKVKMLNGALKSLMVDDSQAVGPMMALICAKIGLTNYDEYSLEIPPDETDEATHPGTKGTMTRGTMGRKGTMGKGTMGRIKDGDRELDPKIEELKQILKTEDGVNWVDHSKTLREQGIVDDDVLLLKRKYFYSDANIDDRDPIQLNLLYEQAKLAILDGTHPVPMDKAVVFAAYQLQIQFGDFREQTHQPGVLDLKEFLPQTYVKAQKIEKKILAKHKELKGFTELDAKVKYVKLARNLPTFGVHFFLVKERQKSKKKLIPRLLGVTKDSVLRLDERTKEILHTWPLTTVRRWVASPNVFTLDFGDYQDQYYSVQTTEGEHIHQLIAGYIDIILKHRDRREHIGDEGDEGMTMEEEWVQHGRAFFMHGPPGGTPKKPNEGNLAKPGVIHPPSGTGKAQRNGHAQTIANGGQQPVQMNLTDPQRALGQVKPKLGQQPVQMNLTDPQRALGQVKPKWGQQPVQMNLTGPQRALVTTISNGQESIHKAEDLLLEKAKLPPLGNDPASYRWKATEKSTKKQSIHSQVSAMNAATAQMVTLTGQGSETDYTAVGSAVNTISSNLPEMAKGVKMLAALMDDDGDGNGDDLMGAAKHLCTAFTDLLAATEPESKRPRQSMLTAASQVGSASHRVLYTIGEEEVADKERQDILLGLAKAVANTTAALVLKAKNVASKCNDQSTQNRVIGAATQCALCTSQLVACAKVVAPTISDPLCQEQLVESCKEVSKSVDGCVVTCSDVCRDPSALGELEGSASDVTRALNELLNHVKDGHADRIPDIMDQIMTASGELIASYDSSEMVRQARILTQSTAELIQAIKGEAESQSDSELQRRLLSAARDLADATAKMVEAAQSVSADGSNQTNQAALKRAAETLRNTTSVAVSTTMKRKMIKRLENASKHAAATATQCIAASQGAGAHNSNQIGQQQLMDSCKSVADVIPRLVEGVRMSGQNPESAMAQLNLITNAQTFLDPSIRLAGSTRSALPTVSDQSASLQLANASRQMENALKDLKVCVGRAQQVCGSLEIEVTADVIDELRRELEEFRVAADAFDLKPLPGETADQASYQLSSATKAVGSKITQLTRAAGEGSRDDTNIAARDTANALRDFTAAVRGVAATTNDRGAQHKIIDQAQLVMERSYTMVLEAQRSVGNPTHSADPLYTAGKAVTVALDGTLSCLPGQEELDGALTHISTWSRQIDSGDFPVSGRPYGELQSQLTNAADKLNGATSGVVQSAARPDHLAESSRKFGQVLGEVMEVSMDMAGQTRIESTRSEMVITMRNVTTSSSTLMASAKSVAADPKSGQAKNNLTAAAMGVTESINDLINVYTSASPGQNECDNAVRAIQASKHVLENAGYSGVSDMSYYECLDTVMEKSKALGDGMTGIANHAKKSEHEEFGDSVKSVADAICGLVEAAAQSAYLVGVSDPSSVTGRAGLIDQSQFVRAAQAIKQACQVLCNANSGQQQILSSATVIAKHTNVICNSCRQASSATNDQSAKRTFVQSAKEVANATATLVKEIKNLDSNYNEANRATCSNATRPLIEAVDNLCQFAGSPEFASLPAKISHEGREAQAPILDSGYYIIDGSCQMIQSAKSLAINPKDPPTWQALANSSKAVSDSIKKLVSSIRDKAPGQSECDDAIDTLTMNIRDLDSASLAAINQNFTARKDKEAKYFTEQMESAAKQINQKLPEVQAASKTEAERLGHSVANMVSFFDPLVNNAIGFASNMVSSKQQILVLDQTKTVAECAQQLLYAAKESGGNPKATHVHADIDESAEAMSSSIYDLQASIKKLEPQIGSVSRIVNCITEAIFTVEDYRPGSRQGQDEDSTFVLFQTNMMASTKEIARTAQNIVIQSTNEPDKLGGLATNISTQYQQLANDAKRASLGTSSAEMGQRIRVSVQELGQATIELVKATGSCQVTPSDSHVLRNVSENARSVSEKCHHVLSALSAANTNVGIKELEEAANTVSGILGDLDTTIMFATAGTYNADVNEDNFSDHREKILTTAKALVEDTKTLVAGAASSQEQLAKAAENAVTTIVQLSDVVKSGAASLGSNKSEGQVLLLNAVKDVASALGDLMQSTKAASGKSIQDPAMHHLKDSAKIMVTNVTSLLKTVKAVEDEHTRGTRALESSIEAIAQEIRSFDSSSEMPRGKAEPEELVRATRPITLATSKAVAAGKSLKQEDIIVAANVGRKAVSDMLKLCKAAAYTSENVECQTRALRAGHDVAVQYRELLQMVMHNLVKPSAEGQAQLGTISTNIAQCVKDLVEAAQNLKDRNWVDPSDPTIIAENELLRAAQSIEAAATKLASLQPRTETRQGQDVDTSMMNFDELILEAAKAIANATSQLIKAASAAQRELVAQGKVSKSVQISTEDGQWSKGLVSAAQVVAEATKELCDAANALVKGLESGERLIAASKQVAASTAQLVIACQVKADPESGTMRSLEGASVAVRKATDNLVQQAQKIFKKDTQSQAHPWETATGVRGMSERIRIQAEIEKKRRELAQAEKAYKEFNQLKYRTDSDTEQSGYESSGYDDTFFGRQQRGYSNASPFRPSQVAASSALFSSPDVSASEAPQHTIESGPSFNESLERFRSATDGETSDGEGLRPAATPSSYKQSVFKQSSHQQQKYSQQTHSSSFSSSQHRTTKSVEEQRTISSKTYRIE